MNPEPDRRSKVLIVDDVDTVRNAVAIILELWGLEVSQAESSEEALSLARSTPVDLVISDIAHGFRFHRCKWCCLSQPRPKARLSETSSNTEGRLRRPTRRTRV